MKIGLPVRHGDLNARVEDRLGTAAHLMVVDTDDLSCEVAPGPPASLGPGAGIHAVSLLLGMGAEVVLTGYISPPIADSLRKGGIIVVTGVSGSVRDAVEEYSRGGPFLPPGEGAGSESPVMGRPERFRTAFGKALRQFSAMLPILMGVVLLIGLFREFLPAGLLLRLFPGDPFGDTLLGACAGSLLAGNPVNSYVIGRGLLEMGVSLFGVCALMLSWVSVGLLQAPAEVGALGMRFAVLRNIAAFVVVLFSSLVIVWLSGGA